MRTFAQKPKADNQTTVAESAIPSRLRFGRSSHVNPILHIQRAIGNQWMFDLMGQGSQRCAL
jgi:hypothetical protein